MNRTWILSVLIISLTLLAILKSHELRTLTPYFKSEKVIKLKSFQEARSKVNKNDLELLKLWESILTGRSAPLSKWMKERYQKLGLNHLFTPSGFHLSAVLVPFMKFTPLRYHLPFLVLIGGALFLLPGLVALKRMLVIKTNQMLLGTHIGFICALIIDVLFGSFQNGALSFTYSFLFLGIIYSGLKGLNLIIWFFIAQMILAFFQGNDISFLLLVFSPILNFGFGILMPLLFLLSFPLWDWQLHLGIWLLKLMQIFVDVFTAIHLNSPSFEVNMAVLTLIFFFLYQKRKSALVLYVFMSFSLNLDRARTPQLAANDFVPQGKIVKTVYREQDVQVVFSDGSCRMKLVRGLWQENCSPKRRSSRNFRTKKLSYPS